MLVALGLLPVLTAGLLAYALRPTGPVFGALRLALVRAAVVLGAGAAVLVEVLSAVPALTVPALVAAWSVALGLAIGAGWLRYRRDGGAPRVVLGALTRAERVIAVALTGLLLAELVIALVAPPNNWDSQTYHLPKIEHWVAQRDVDVFATRINRQVVLAPGAEYLLLQLRLLTGGDALYNLLQWGAGLGCALVASRIAGQLGGGRLAQLLTAFLVGTTPLVVLESTSTQTDLVVAAWVVAVATLVLDELDRRTPGWTAALLGAAAGLTTLTKATGLLGVVPLLLVWTAGQLRRAPLRALANLLLAGAVAVAVAGPFLARMDATYGNALGPASLRASTTMERHDLASVLVNALKIGYTALETPVGPLDRAASGTVIAIAHGLGVNPDDPLTSWRGPAFPTLSWPPDEDRAAFPVQGVLVLLGAAVLVFRRRTRRYAAVFWLVVLLYVTGVKWQPWGNRLILFVLVLGAPLAGLWLAGVLERRRPQPRAAAVGAWAAAGALLAAGCAGWLAVGYGWPRRLVGPGSVFTESRTEARFNRRPQWLADYEFAADPVRAAGARTVGLVQGGDTWEYPWWVLLPGARIEALQSDVPGHPPAVRPDQVDAIVCVTGEAECAQYVPARWTLRMHGTVGYALRPR
jgi:hypothetical protein